MKRLAAILPLLLLLAALFGCGSRTRVSARLDALDTLVSRPPSGPPSAALYDSVFQVLDTLMYDVVGLGEDVEARWHLLYAAAEDKADRPLLFDTHVRPAYDYYRDATQDGTQGDSTLLHRFAQSCFYMGVHYYHSDSTALMEQMMYQSADVAKSCGDHYTAYLALTYLSSQLNWSNNNIACSMALKALDEYHLSGNRNLYNELCILINIGYIYLNGFHWKDALPYLEKALLCSVNKMDSLCYGDVLYGLSAYYHKANDPAKSIALLDDGISHITENYENCLYIGEILIANDSLERANDFLRLALEKGAKDKAIIFSRLQKIAILQHDDVRALIYGDSVLRASLVKHYYDIYQNYDINVSQLEQNRKILLAEHRLFMQRSVFTIIIVVFVFLLVLFLLILRQRKKRRDQAQRFEKERIAYQLAEKDKVISMLRMHLTNKSEVIATFKSIGSEHPESFRLSSDDWLYLEKTLDDVDGNFVSNLRMQNPDINYDFIKLAMLIRIGLSNKQMAEVFNLTIEAIKKRKQKLRKYIEVLPLQKDISSI